ncbi:hypothetical protein ACTHGU_07470 [Chitinophagaceae bacterium MMS25-I14]
MTEEMIINSLQNLTDKQFTELFYKAVQNRRYTSEGQESHWVLGEAIRFPAGEENDWELRTLCIADSKEYSAAGWDDSAPICQSGWCCNHETASYAKHAICSICEKEVYGT